MKISKIKKANYIKNKQEKDFYCENVLSEKIAIEKLYESKEVLAFYHTKPSYKIHIVIFSKKHIKDLIELNEKHKEIIWEIMKAAKKIINDLDLENKGARLITNLGKYQDSKHLHFHLVSGDKK